MWNELLAIAFFQSVIQTGCFNDVDQGRKEVTMSS